MGRSALDARMGTIPANDFLLPPSFPRTKPFISARASQLCPSIIRRTLPRGLRCSITFAKGGSLADFGQGGVPCDWELFDLPDGRTQGLMTVEGIDMVVKLWTTEPPFDFKGDFWHIKIEHPMPDVNMGRMIRPFQQPHPQIAMSIVKGGSMASSYGRAARVQTAEHQSRALSTVANHWKTYSEGAAEAGNPEPDRSLWSVSRTIFIGESDDQAMDFAMNSTLADSYTYTLKLLAATNMTPLTKVDLSTPDSAINAEYMIKNLCLIGGPKTVVQRIEELWETTGGFGTLLMIAHDWDDKDKWIKSIERLDKQVAPKLPTL